MGLLWLVTVCATSTLVLHSGAATAVPVCPESKKLHPGDCHLFYKCVPIPGAAQAYVWVPSRCTAGMVFEPSQRRCVTPSIGSKLSSCSAFPPTKEEKTKKSPPADDPIAVQLQRLTQIIGTLKATTSDSGDDEHFDIVDTHFPTTHELNLLPAQIHKITAQLISRPYPNNPEYSRRRTQIQHQSNPSWPQGLQQQEIPQAITAGPDKVVSDLYRKYLVNGTFYKKAGEFARPIDRKKCDRVGERLADRDNCTKYYICKGNNAVIGFHCPFNMFFDQKVGACCNYDRNSNVPSFCSEKKLLESQL